MPEGYCVKCRTNREICGAADEVLKNGRRAIRGTCPECGTTMLKILGGPAKRSSEIVPPGAYTPPDGNPPPGLN